LHHRGLQQGELAARLGQHLVFQQRALALAGADDKGQQARRPAQHAAVEDELRGRLGVAGKCQHGPRQRAPAGARYGLHIDRGDGFEAQRLGGASPVAQRHDERAGRRLRALRDQPRRLGAGGGQEHGVEGRAVHQPALALRRGSQGLHAPPGFHGGAVRLQPARGGFGEQRPQVLARQQQVAAAACAEQAVLQHAQEHLAAGW